MKLVASKLMSSGTAKGPYWRKQHSCVARTVKFREGNRKATTCAAVIATAVFSSSYAKAETSWDWFGEIYLWGASLGGETTSGSSVDVSFGSLLDNLKLGGMAAVKAEQQRWTLFADLLYLDVSDSENGSLDLGSGPISASVEVDARSFISTFGAAYTLSETPTSKVSALGGARYLWLDSELDASVGGSSERISDTESTWDAVVGITGDFDLSDRWYLVYYADVGAGQSDLTWQALLAAHYRLEKFDLSFGYRYLEWNLRDFGSFDKLDVSGPFIGARFKF